MRMFVHHHHKKIYRKKTQTDSKGDILITQHTVTVTSCAIYIHFI